MFKGFYNLTSGMITQQRNLNVVSNNLTNVSTTGFKSERYTSTTFDDVIYSRAGNKYKDYEDIGNQSYMRVTSDTYIDYTQGTMEYTAIPLDFAIYGDGFFAINSDNGVVYTRAGNFSLDDQGYLCLNGFGRVLNTNGGSIYLGTDQIKADNAGRIYSEAGNFLGQLGVYNFANTDGLEHNEEGFFVGAGAVLSNDPDVWHKYIERSNSDMVSLMTELISVQRAFQSTAEVATMYDSLMSQATNDVGRL